MKTEPSQTVPILFPPKLVADRWGVHAITVRRLIASGALASVQVGGRRLVPVDAIVAAEKKGVGTRRPRTKRERA
jgi:excisionase family DNA binding protein